MTVTGVATVTVCGDGLKVLRSRLAVDQRADHDLEQFNRARASSKQKKVHDVDEVHPGVQRARVQMLTRVRS
jgi:hypothetical protein